MTLPRASSQSASSDSTQRVRRPLPTELDHKLFAYASVAMAAGVSIIAQPAHAKVVYTAVNVPIPVNSTLAIDVNNDGIPDFTISNGSYQPARFPLGYHEAGVGVLPKFDNAVVASGKESFCAGALNSGVTVGPNSPFQAKNITMWISAGSYTYSGPGICPWKGSHPPHAYLALKFTAGGLTHYGWARFSFMHVQTHAEVTLTGYAYETVPNQSIKTGVISGPSVKPSRQLIPEMKAPAPIAANLGLLARGASVLAIWRRPDDLQ
jgi:hypothetical protein